MAGQTELTPAAYVVLGMVRLGARSGYEVKREVERSVRFFWTISPVQVYPNLERLERAGLVRGRDEPQGKRPRRAYVVTEAGQAALRHWLCDGAPMPFELRDIGLVKLFFADALGPGQAAELLTAVRRRSEERLSSLEAIEPAAAAAHDAGNLYPLLTLRMGIAYHRAMIEVCADFARHAVAG